MDNVHSYTVLNVSRCSTNQFHKYFVSDCNRKNQWQGEKKEPKVLIVQTAMILLLGNSEYETFSKPNGSFAVLTDAKNLNS